MNYYTSTIPLTLAEKLKEKGMPIFIEQEWYSNGMPKAEKDCHKPMTKYCEVFDWLTEKGIYVGITRTFARWGWLLFQDYAILQEHYGTWHEAANAAIEKALTLI